jgi:hypothetical protein
MTVDEAGTAASGESKSERADRRWVELLQEVRVAQTGVQILLAFLLSVAFTPRFADLTGTDRVIYVVTIVLGAAATAALIAPVPLHRTVTGQRMKPKAVKWASRFTVTGLLLLLCTIVCAMLLILRFVLSDGLAAWIVLGILTWFVVCWVVLPAWVRRTG